MDHLVNQPFLTKRAKIARWGSYVGFGALFIGLMTARQPWISYLFLLIGLLGASVGAYLANRYVREPRPDQSLASAMEELDKRYALFSYYLPSNHVVASHYGLTVLEPRAQQGEVRFVGGRWRHKAGFRKVLQFFGEPSLGRPDQDLAQEMKWVKDWIDKVMPEGDIPVNGAIVFTHAKVDLQMSGQTSPAMVAADLARFMKEGLKGASVLTTARQKELRRALDETVAQA
jgi:hypothetical protein